MNYISIQSMVLFILSIFIYLSRNMAAKQERDHMRAMGQFVPDSEDEGEEMEEQVDKMDK